MAGGGVLWNSYYKGFGLGGQASHQPKPGPYVYIFWSLMTKRYIRFKSGLVGHLSRAAMAAI